MLLHKMYSERLLIRHDVTIPIHKTLQIFMGKVEVGRGIKDPISY